MALSRTFIEEHIAGWEGRLRGGFYPHREKWPSRLFHHGPIENIVSILNSGLLRSRADPMNPRVRDVAGAGVIDVRAAAHRFVRLYFRPRTPTQFHIEGVRKEGDCQYGPHAHAPVLVMLVLDARRVLSLPDVCFSDRNMQMANVPVMKTEAQFAAIPFDKVFSEGGTGGDRSVIEHRCAEVLTPSPLELADCLQWVYCRSEAERAFLINELGREGLRWLPKIIVSDDLKVFEKKFAFIDDISLGSEGVIFRLSPREDRRDINVRVELWDEAGAQLLNFENEMSAIPRGAARWIVKRELNDGLYRVRVQLEGHRAFEGRMSVGDVLF